MNILELSTLLEEFEKNKEILEKLRNYINNTKGDLFSLYVEALDKYIKNPENNKLENFEIDSQLIFVLNKLFSKYPVNIVSFVIGFLLKEEKKDFLNMLNKKYNKNVLEKEHIEAIEKQQVVKVIDKTDNNSSKVFDLSDPLDLKNFIYMIVIKNFGINTKENKKESNIKIEIIKNSKTSYLKILSKTDDLFEKIKYLSKTKKGKLKEYMNILYYINEIENLLYNLDIKEKENILEKIHKGGTLAFQENNNKLIFVLNSVNAFGSLYKYLKQKKLLNKVK